jgi:hypothetical protein
MLGGIMLGRIALNLALAGGGLVAGHLFEKFMNGTKKSEPEPRKTIPLVRTGDLVQWESDGAFVFPEPKKVVDVKLHPLGSYVFVEGSDTGVPIEQVVVVRRRSGDYPYADEWPKL